MATRVPDHITLCTDLKSTAQSSPVVIGRTEVDLDKYPMPFVAEVLARVKKGGGGSGFFRVYDATNNQALGQLEFTEDEPTQKKLELSNFPASGQVSIELQIKTDGNGTVYMTGSSIQVI